MAGQVWAGPGRAGQDQAGQGWAGRGRAGPVRAKQGWAGPGWVGQGRAGPGKDEQARARAGRAGQGRPSNYIFVSCTSALNHTLSVNIIFTQRDISVNIVLGRCY